MFLGSQSLLTAEGDALGLPETRGSADASRRSQELEASLARVRRHCADAQRRVREEDRRVRRRAGESAAFYIYNGRKKTHTGKHHVDNECLGFKNETRLRKMSQHIGCTTHR